MSGTIDVLISGVLLGIAATVIFDVWILLQKSLGLPALNFNFLGRWVANFKSLKFTHTAIKEAPKVKFELYVGIVAHYLIGIFIAFLLIMINGESWLKSPDVISAILIGIATVVFPLLIMQPAMGAGFSFLNTAHPIKNSLKSALNHTVFGGCLYLSGLLLAKLNF
ncbi:MAG: DUF2938 family protein [Methylotenera sp.]|jgi:hypothetical protein|uniref:DUF2938 family protein n=1 Tax=Methylotenera sp. TaxID=2051956 RepID=UPI002720509F|nr:DUF2938 family protein [Methylotenera sp.]MDO9151540.1 DUF2938 family protein [Methylotenera sp.]